MTERHFRRGSRRDSIGTGKVGELSSDWSADELNEVFGPAEDTSETSDGKTTMEWRIRFDDGAIATIYDWHGFRWSIGGRGKNVADRVEALLTAYQQPDAIMADAMCEEAVNEDPRLLITRARIARLETQLRILGHKPIA